MSLFKQKYRVAYVLDVKHLGGHTLERDVPRVPRIGEHLKLECYGDQLHEVISVATVEKHDPGKNYYVITTRRVE